jgi:hypothetical protein
MTKEQKRSLLRALGTSYGKGTDLAALLWLQGKEEEARSVEHRNAELRRAIDRLRRDIWKAWHGRAEALQARIGSLNRKLQTRIRQIEKAIGAAQELVKALRVLDEVIEITVAVIA